MGSNRQIPHQWETKQTHTVLQVRRQRDPKGERKKKRKNHPQLSNTHRGNGYECTSGSRWHWTDAASDSGQTLHPGRSASCWLTVGLLDDSCCWSFMAEHGADIRSYLREQIHQSFGRSVWRRLKNSNPAPLGDVFVFGGSKTKQFIFKLHKFTCELCNPCKIHDNGFEEPLPQSF